MNNDQVRKELCKTIIHRISATGIAGKVAEKTAKNMILGASNLALIQGDKETGQFLHSMFTDVVEFGLRLVYKWGEITMPQKTEDKEAA